MNLDFASAAREVGHAMPLIIAVGGAIGFGAYRFYEAIKNHRALASRSNNAPKP